MKPSSTFLALFLAVLFSGLTLHEVAAKSDDAKMHTYTAPMQGKKRLAYCYSPNEGCGEKAANEWCKTKGFKGAKKWEVQHQVKGKLKSGRYIGSDVACKGMDCDLFESIICRMGPPTFF